MGVALAKSHVISNSRPTPSSTVSLRLFARLPRQVDQPPPSSGMILPRGAHPSICVLEVTPFVFFNLIPAAVCSMRVLPEVLVPRV